MGDIEKNDGKDAINPNHEIRFVRIRMVLFIYLVKMLRDNGQVHKAVLTLDTSDIRRMNNTEH